MARDPNFKIKFFLAKIVQLLCHLSKIMQLQKVKDYNVIQSK